MSSPHRFVVRRQEWTPPDATGIRRLLPEKWTRVAEFRTADDAHAKYAELLADARRTLNPFHLGGPALFYQTSLPPHDLHDFLLDRDIIPPANSLSSSPNYAFWWVKSNRTFTDDQRARVWAACDKLTLFDVIEEDDREAAHVVVELCRVDNGEQWVRLAEGGFVRSVFRTRKEATKAQREFIPDDEPAEDDTPSPPGSAAEVVSVQFVDLKEGQSAFVIARQSFENQFGEYAHHDEFDWNLGCRVPLLATASKVESAERLRTLTHRVRRTVNPLLLIGDRHLSWQWLFSWQDFEPQYFGRRFSAARGSLFDEECELPNGLTLSDALDTVRKLPTHVPAPPDDNTAAWVAWYDRVVQWSPEYVDVIWGTFADFRLFEVIEVPWG